MSQLDDQLRARVSPAALAALEKYLQLLLLWNRRINLTACRDRAEILERHFLDSLEAAGCVPPSARSVVDVGSGAGFPGGVIAIVRPEVAVTLVESNHKKAAFLTTLRHELGLTSMTVLAERCEDVCQTRAHSFDVAVSRATWDVVEWLETGAELVKPLGVVLGMEGPTRHDLPVYVERHPYRLAGQDRAILVRRSLLA